jgi:hypothetical protein
MEAQHRAKEAQHGASSTGFITSARPTRRVLDGAQALPDEDHRFDGSKRSPNTQGVVMHHLNKKLVITAAASALLASLGLAVAQSTDATDPSATPKQQVDISADGPGNHIYFFRDQGISAETDPAAHLMLIKHDQMVPVAETTSTTTTTVAQASTPSDTVTTTMPAASDTSNTETSSDTSTAAAPVDTTPALAPKADRN